MEMLTYDGNAWNILPFSIPHLEKLLLKQQKVLIVG